MDAKEQWIRLTSERVESGRSSSIPDLELCLIWENGVPTIEGGAGDPSDPAWKAVELWWQTVKATYEPLAFAWINRPPIRALHSSIRADRFDVSITFTPEGEPWVTPLCAFLDEDGFCVDDAGIDLWIRERIAQDARCDGTSDGLPSWVVDPGVEPMWRTNPLPELFGWKLSNERVMLRMHDAISDDIAEQLIPPGSDLPNWTTIGNGWFV